MVEKRPTPEEELLNLIEKGKGAGGAKFKRRRKFILNFAGLKGSVFSFGRGISRNLIRFKRGLREPNLKVLNKIFLIISCSLIGCSIMDFIYSRPDIEEVYRKGRQKKGKSQQGEMVPEIRSFLHYLEMVNRRNIFSPILLKEAKKTEIKSEQLREMIKDLNLVGISWGSEPMAMIEDKKAKKTYFLKKGEPINKLFVDTIYENKVILSYEEKTVELM